MAEPIRVLHLTRWLLPVGGGIRTYLAHVARSVDPARVQMQAAALEPGSPPAYIPEVRYMGTPGDSRAVAILRFWHWLRGALRERVDVVHIHGVFHPLLMLGAGACLRSGLPYVVSAHGALEPWALRRRARAKLLFLACGGRRRLRRSAALLATTEGNAAALRALDREFPVRVAMPGVEVPEHPEADFLKADAPGPLRTLFIARLEPVKGLELLLDAVALLARAGTSVRLDVVGDGPAAYVGAMQARVRQHRLDAAVTFHGYLDGRDKERLLRAAHVLAVPSHAENFSFVTAEALAAGVPVVVTDAVGLADLVARSECGEVVSPGDAPRLAAALARHADPALRSRRGRRAHACATEHLSLAAMGRALEQVYVEAAATRGMP